MAVDETLLDAAIDRKQCAVRVYQWSHPTVSIGYFQDSEWTICSPELKLLPMVKRLTGGGAIVHQHELTYSCSVPTTSGLAKVPHHLYNLVHNQIITVLARYGVTARMRSNCGQSAYSATEPFLCFGRTDANDIILKGHKILGSAQRRRRGAILQHGSLLIKNSPHASQYQGVLDLVPEINFEKDFKFVLASAIGLLFSKEFRLEPLVPSELTRVSTS